jgi:hypothetical protein
MKTSTKEFKFFRLNRDFPHIPHLKKNGTHESRGIPQEKMFDIFCPDNYAYVMIHPA